MLQYKQTTTPPAMTAEVRASSSFTRSTMTSSIRHALFLMLNSKSVPSIACTLPRYRPKAKKISCIAEFPSSVPAMLEMMREKRRSTEGNRSSPAFLPSSSPMPWIKVRKRSGQEGISRILLQLFADVRSRVATSFTAAFLTLLQQTSKKASRTSSARVLRTSPLRSCFTSTSSSTTMISRQRTQTSCCSPSSSLEHRLICSVLYPPEDSKSLLTSSDDDIRCKARTRRAVAKILSKLLLSFMMKMEIVARSAGQDGNRRLPCLDEL
mmetsp:Transcript_51032/g.159465  ORF Transcript_51032/g.159465 Transcript_51032/m.159465 type:complete len:267 (+) Transcript_51032:341-1141(+)